MSSNAPTPVGGSLPALQRRGGQELSAMLRLDALTVRPWLKGLGFFVLMAVAFAFLLKQPELGLMMVLIGALVSVLNLFASDEAYRLPYLYGALPVSRRTVITSHYAMAVGFLAVAAAIGGVIGAVAAPPGDRLDACWAALAALGLMWVVWSVEAPITITWGARKAGQVIMGGVFLVGGLGFLVAQWNGGEAASAAPREVPSSMIPLLSAVSVAVGAAALVASWFVAVRIYERHDF